MTRFEVVADETLSEDTHNSNIFHHKAELHQELATHDKYKYWIPSSHQLSTILGVEDATSLNTALLKSQSLTEIASAIEEVQTVGGMKSLTLKNIIGSDGQRRLDSDGALRTLVLQSVLGGTTNRRFDRIFNIGPLEGIASQIYDNTREIAWSGQSDWDNAANKQSIYVPGDTFELGMGMDGWEDYLRGSYSPNTWSFSTATETMDDHAYEGTFSVDASSSNSSTEHISSSSFPDHQIDYPISFIYYETSNNTVTRYKVNTSSGDHLFSMGANNPGVSVVDADGGREFHDPSTSYSEHRRMTVRNWDWENRTAEVLWEDLTGGDPDQTETINFRSATTDDVSQISIGHTYDHHWGGGNVDYWVDNVYGIRMDGSLTTATKSFSNTTKPNLGNLSYNLNGQTITIDAIGSPGTSSEEIVSQTLDGASSYSLSWANNHQDFRLRINLKTSSGDTSPTFTGASLIG